MANKLFSWKAGDIFGIPLGSDEYGLGQVLSPEKKCMDSVLCCFTKVITKEITLEIHPIEIDDLISVQIVTRDSLDQGIWRVFGSSEPIDIGGLYPIESLRNNRYVGAKIRGSGAMQKLVLAYHGRSPWDEYFDPHYFDKLLIDGLSKPVGAIYKSTES